MTASPEPDYIRQTADVPNDRMYDWFKSCNTEASKEGCTWFRYSRHPEHTNIYLTEGWKTRPNDEGEPRFALVPV